MIWITSKDGSQVYEIKEVNVKTQIDGYYLHIVLRGEDSSRNDYTADLKEMLKVIEIP